MIRPPATNDAVKAFMQKMANTPSMLAIEAIKRVGNPLFTQKDIDDAIYPLDKILRQYCLDNNVTEEHFTEMYKNYAYNVLRMHETKVNNQKTNLLRTLRDGHITWKKLLEFISVMGLRVMDLKLVILDLNNVQKEYKLSDCVRQKK